LIPDCGFDWQIFIAHLLTMIRHLIPMIEAGDFRHDKISRVLMPLAMRVRLFYFREYLPGSKTPQKRSLWRTLQRACTVTAQRVSSSPMATMQILIWHHRRGCDIKRAAIPDRTFEEAILLLISQSSRPASHSRIKLLKLSAKD
jgi:hypothetical protein